MAKFWLDSNVFIQAKNLYYAFDIVPGFWQMISDSSESGEISCPMMVYNEIAKGGDELTDWANIMKPKKLFVEPDQSVQEFFSALATSITGNGQYHPAQIALFLRGADPWVISCASTKGGTVVSQEKLVGADSAKVKIPNLCKDLGIQCINSYEMIRRLGKKFN